MKVLLQIRPNYEKKIAGDSTQAKKTMEYLKEIGLDVSLSTSNSECLKDYDLVHIFNVTHVSEAYGFYKNAVRQDKKIIISPIFIDMQEFYRFHDGKKLAAWRSANLLRREVLAGSNLLLPNSEREALWIKNILYVDTPSRIVHNGVDKGMAKGDEEWFIKKYGLKNFILCVGRLSPIKNQLALIQATRGLSSPVILIGPVNDAQYAKMCAQEGEGRVKYIPFLEHNELASAYKAAKVHVQPSFFETVGLTSLEAAAAGTRVVITERGGAKEYFQDRARYINPSSLESIRSATMDILNKPGKDDNLQEHILENFSWQNTAVSTLKAYEDVLSGSISVVKEIRSNYFAEYPIRF